MGSIRDAARMPLEVAPPVHTCHTLECVARCMAADDAASGHGSASWVTRDETGRVVALSGVEVPGAVLCRRSLNGTWQEVAR